jgi:transcriptional regulator with XRE-family HTH domain
MPKGGEPMAKKLTEKQIAAIEYLSLPNRGGLAYEQIADELGVDISTLYRWRNDDTFHSALTRKIIRNTADRLPDVLESVPDHIIKDGNAAMLRTLLQAHGLLTDKVEVDSKNNRDSDIDDMKAQIERFREKNNAGDKNTDI